MLTLKTPEQLTQLVESLVLSATEQYQLNKRMANHARQFFRSQIRKQRDIENTPYQARSSRTVRRINRGKQVKRGEKHQRQLVALHTENNKNMLYGFIRGLRTQVSEDSFAVGLTGVAGKIGRQHNEGERISFSARVNGFFNPKTSRWEGGYLTKRNYEMPKRAFIGWTPQLERELMAMAAEHFVRQDATK